MAIKAVISGGRPGLLSYVQDFNESSNPCHESSPGCASCSRREADCGLTDESDFWNRFNYCNFYGIGCVDGRSADCCGGSSGYGCGCQHMLLHCVDQQAVN
jgi:hypothetical protein